MKTVRTMVCEETVVRNLAHLKWYYRTGDLLRRLESTDLSSAHSDSPYPPDRISFLPSPLRSKCGFNPFPLKANLYQNNPWYGGKEDYDLRLPQKIALGIYRYFGYLILRAWPERQPLWIVVGVLVAIVYDGMLWGILPADKGVSWEAHLCGFLGGLWLGRNHGLLSLAKM